MKIHLQFDRNDEQHAHLTLFINGQNNGTLCVSPAEAIWLNHIFSAGTTALSPKGMNEIQYVASGKPPHPPDKDINACVGASEADSVSNGLTALHAGRVSDEPMPSNEMWDALSSAPPSVVGAAGDSKEQQ